MKYFFTLLCQLCCLFLVTKAAVANSSSHAFFVPPKVGWGHALNSGAVMGYVQTPLGGRPGSSDLYQPTFTNLGISHAPIYDSFWLAQWKQIGLYGGYETIRPAGVQQLTQQLKTYGISIPAGAIFNTDIKFDWYRLGVQYAFYLLPHRLQLLPEIELVLLDFAYQFWTTSTTGKRTYRHAGLRTGIGVNYTLTSAISLFADAATTFSLSQFDILTFAAGLQLHLSENTTCFLGGRFIKIDFRDGQTLPNDIHLHTKFIPRIGCSSMTLTAKSSYAAWKEIIKHKITRNKCFSRTVSTV